MSQDAIDFANWISINCKMIVSDAAGYGSSWEYKDGFVYHAEDLYELFKKQP